MQNSTEAYRDETADYESDLGFVDSHHNPMDWAVDSDEAGDRIYCATTISDYLQRDSI
jgi:hypothetical protein